MELEYKYPEIPTSKIRDEVRKIAVVWSENMEPAAMWYVNKVKLASDIQNYADQYAAEKLEEFKQTLIAKQ